MGDEMHDVPLALDAAIDGLEEERASALAGLDVFVDFEFALGVGSYAA